MNAYQIDNNFKRLQNILYEEPYYDIVLKTYDHTVYVKHNDHYLDKQVLYYTFIINGKGIARYFLDTGKLEFKNLYTASTKNSSKSTKLTNKKSIELLKNLLIDLDSVKLDRTESVYIDLYDPFPINHPIKLWNFELQKN
jgi:hypothetical protein